MLTFCRNVRSPLSKNGVAREGNRAIVFSPGSCCASSAINGFFDIFTVRAGLKAFRDFVLSKCLGDGTHKRRAVRPAASAVAVADDQLDLFGGEK